MATIDAEDADRVTVQAVAVYDPRRALVARACIAGPDHCVAVANQGFVLRTDVDLERYRGSKPRPGAQCASATFEAKIAQETAQYRFYGAACMTGYCDRCAHLFYTSATQIPVDPEGRDAGRVEIVTVDANQ
jgi:hypothetical protein